MILTYDLTVWYKWEMQGQLWILDHGCYEMSINWLLSNWTNAKLNLMTVDIWIYNIYINRFVCIDCYRFGQWLSIGLQVYHLHIHSQTHFKSTLRLETVKIHSVRMKSVNHIQCLHKWERVFSIAIFSQLDSYICNSIHNSLKFINAIGKFKLRF